VTIFTSSSCLTLQLLLIYRRWKSYGAMSGEWSLAKNCCTCWTVLVWNKSYWHIPPKSIVKIVWHGAKEIPSSPATSLMISIQPSLSNSHFAIISSLLLHGTHSKHSLPSTARNTQKHALSSWLSKILHTFRCTLRHCTTQTLLFIFSDCAGLNGCSKALLVKDTQKKVQKCSEKSPHTAMQGTR
jgi:hypothetical protein